MSYNLTMNDLPEAVGLLMEKVDRLLAQQPSSGLPKAEKELLTIKEAADLLNKSVPTIYGYTSAKKIPFIKNEGKLMFERSKLLKYLSSHSQETLADTIDQKFKKK